MIEWEEVRPFFEEYGCVMVDNPELRWYQESWGALERTGLTGSPDFAGTDTSEVMVKLRAVCLLAMYNGCHQVARGSVAFGEPREHEAISLYLEALNSDIGEFRDWAVRRGLIERDGSIDPDEEANSGEELEALAIELVEGENAAIFGALQEHYGDLAGLFVSIWNSRLPLDKIESFDDVMNSIDFYDGRMDVFQYVSEGMAGWWWD